MPQLKIKAGKAIFISHASPDKAITQDFIDLILVGALGVGIETIFASTIEGTKIESGDDWRDSIKENLKTAKITFIIITPHYKESEVSLNEMGAAWVLSGKTLPVIVDPINYKTVGVIQQPNQIEKLLDEGSLDRIKDIVQAELEIPNEKIKSDRWTQKKKEFIKKLKKHIEENPFPLAMDRKSYDGLIQENLSLNKTVDNLIDEKEILENQIKDLEKAKTADEVKKIKEKYHPSDLWEEFIELCSAITKQLNKHKSIIRGIIFNTYSHKNMAINWQASESIIDEARAEDIIDEDMEADWETTRKMKSLYDSLQKLEKFMAAPLDSSFMEKYEEVFDAPFKIDNRNFWEEAFGLNLSF